MVRGQDDCRVSVNPQGGPRTRPHPRTCQGACGLVYDGLSELGRARAP